VKSLPVVALTLCLLSAEAFARPRIDGIFAGSGGPLTIILDRFSYLHDINDNGFVVFAADLRGIGI
jgi:hypothetical protein